MITQQEAIERIGEVLNNSERPLPIAEAAASTGLRERIIRNNLKHFSGWSLSYDQVLTPKGYAGQSSQEATSTEAARKAQQIVLNGESLEVTLPGPHDRF